MLKSRDPAPTLALFKGLTFKAQEPQTLPTPEVASVGRVVRTPSSTPRERLTALGPVDSQGVSARLRTEHSTSWSHHEI